MARKKIDSSVLIIKGNIIKCRGLCYEMKLTNQLIAVIPKFGRLRQKDCLELMASLCYMLS